jgi:hypothetical protein
MLELIKALQFEKWAVPIVFVILLWQYVLKSAFELWLKHQSEMQKQQIGNTLAIQKELVIKQTEFETVKLERVLPLLEEINGTILKHNMMFRTYTSAIVNKSGYPDNMEALRLEQDEKIIKAISSISIYIPSEFRILLYKIRRVISCSWDDSLRMYRVLREIGNTEEVPFAAQALYSDLVNCYYEMCNNYIGIGDKAQNYSDILSNHNLNSDVVTTKTDPINQLAWKFILLPEYYGDNNIIEAQYNLEEFYKIKYNKSADV